MTMGERIQIARKKAGMKQSDLAQKLGVAVVTIGQYERGKREPRFEQLRAIAEALGISISELTGEPIRIDVPMPEYAVQMPTKEQLNRMSEVERDYYYLRLLADTAPDELRKKHIENYDKLNKLGKVEAVRRNIELTRLKQYTAPDQRQPPQDTPTTPSEGKDTAPPESPSEGPQEGK